MKILVSLPKDASQWENIGKSIEEALNGVFSISGTIGAIIRLADLLQKKGFDVCLSSNVKISCSKFDCIKHGDVNPSNFDILIVHQSHWNGSSLTFGNQALSKTILWLHLYSNFALVYTFLQAGGYHVVCPSFDCANFFRTVPQWRQKVSVVYNSYAQEIYQSTNLKSENYLLFIGAISAGKGFLELMDIWSYLVKNKADLNLFIAGSIHLHKPEKKLGNIGVADQKFEVEYIDPWLKTLPPEDQPKFLGSLTPRELQMAINKSWAVIVNPSWYAKETFCVSAVEAQACNKTVFSVATGGLKETIYQGAFPSLAKDKKPETLAKLIFNGLSDSETLINNGKLAGDFVREKFSYANICESWIDILSGKNTEFDLFFNWQTPKDFFSDLMRWSKTGALYYSWRSSLDRKMLKNFKKNN